MVSSEEICLHLFGALLLRKLGGHPNFAAFRAILENGMPYHVTTELTEEQCREEMEANILRGNHKSAMEQADVAERLLGKDVKHGFSLPVSKEVVRKLKSAMVQLAGVANQFALQPDGSRVPKGRLTYDLTFEITGECVSVNNRVDMSKYPEMIYGWCLPRCIHFVVALRLAFPDHRILIAKYDFSDAY